MSIVNKIIVGFFIALIVLTNVPKTLADDETPIQQDDFRIYTDLFGSSYQELISVDYCESGGKMVARGKAGEIGRFQYMTETWNRYSRKYRDTFGVSDQFDIYSSHDQIKLTAFVYSLGESSKREWTTYRAIKNNGTYSFTDRHGKYHVVKCKLIV